MKNQSFKHRCIKDPVGRGEGGYILQYNGALAVQVGSAEKGYLSQDSGNSKVGNSRIIKPRSS